MSTRSGKIESRWLQLISAIVVLLAISVSTEGLAAMDGGNAADTASGKRVSVTSRIGKGGRNGNADGSSTTDEYDALRTSGERIQQAPGQSRSKVDSSVSALQSTSFDFWIYNADVILFSDDDHDGYFYGIDLLFDADTVYSVADVYAVVYLSYEGGPWEEYAITEDFTIFGESGSDEYVLITELMSGYPTGEYDILIELFDAYDSSFLASFGPEDTPDLAFLPLEDFNRDEPVVTEVSVAISHGSGGGAAGSWFIAALFTLVLVRRLSAKRG